MVLPRINWGRTGIRPSARRSPPAARPLLSRLPSSPGRRGRLHDESRSRVERHAHLRGTCARGPLCHRGVAIDTHYLIDEVRRSRRRGGEKRVGGVEAALPAEADDDPGGPGRKPNPRGQQCLEWSREPGPAWPHGRGCITRPYGQRTTPKGGINTNSQPLQIISVISAGYPGNLDGLRARRISSQE